MDIIHPLSKVRSGTKPFSLVLALALAFNLGAIMTSSAEQFGLFTYTTNGSSVTITDYPESETGEIEIPAEIEGLPVTGIAIRAFLNCNGLTRIGIPESVETIASQAFRNCSSLTSLELPKGVSSIESSLCDGCTALSSVLIPQSVTSIKLESFRNCSSLASISIPCDVTWIGASAFKGCSALTELLLPDGISVINDATFENCAGLTSIVVPNGVTRINAGAFGACTGLTRAVIGERVATIESNAFGGCTSLVSFYFLGNAPVTPAQALANVPNTALVYYLNINSGFPGLPAGWLGRFTVSINVAVYPAASWLLSHGYDYTDNLQSDLDGDGVSLFLAFALDLNPNKNPIAQLPVASCELDSLEITYYSGRPGITYRAETSEDLVSWTTDGVIVSNQDAEGRRTASVSKNTPARYLRLTLED